MVEQHHGPKGAGLSAAVTGLSRHFFRPSRRGGSRCLNFHAFLGVFRFAQMPNGTDASRFAPGRSGDVFASRNDVANDLDAEALAAADEIDLEIHPNEGSAKTRVLRPEHIVATVISRRVDPADFKFNQEDANSGRKRLRWMMKPPTDPSRPNRATAADRRCRHATFWLS